MLAALPRERGNLFVFIGLSASKPLSNMAMLELLRGVRPGYVPHGFRSTFRDWAADRTNYQNHVVEAALAHVVRDKVEAAYRRGDLFDKRRRLMDASSNYCASVTVSDLLWSPSNNGPCTNGNDMNACVHRVSLSRMVRARGGFTPYETLAAFYGLRGVESCADRWCASFAGLLRR